MKILLLTLKKTGLRYRRFVFFYILASVVISASLVLVNHFQGNMGESALYGDIDTLVWLLILVTGISIVRAIFAGLSTLLLARFSASAGYGLRAHFINNVLGISFSKIEKVGSGESLSIYSNDIPEAENLISSGIMRLLSDFISFAFALTFLLIISPLYTVVMFGAFVILMGLVTALSMPIRKRTEIQSKETANFNAIVNDSLQNLSTIVAYSLEEVMEERYLAAYEKYMVATKGIARAMVPLAGTAFIALFGPLAAIYTVMAFGAINSNLTIAEFIAYTSTIMVAVTGISGVANGIGSLASSFAHAKRLNDNTANALEELHDGSTLDAVGAVDITFKGVSFSYGEDLPLALDDVSFDIKPGNRVAFVGANGSGKSTLLKLLLGLYSPSSGEITIAGQNATKMAKSSLRDLFAYVPQDSFLFPGSIGHNITLESEVSDMKRLEDACADAGILDFINTLPEGFNSTISEASENISGGQRQRIAIARAFYKDAPTILLDEVTSSLDPSTEANIFGGLNKAAKDKTVIMIAHRASAVAICDVVVTMDKGKVIKIENLGRGSAS